MAKYSREQLKAMATEALKAKKQNDPRYQYLVMRIQILTLLPVSKIQQHISRLAKTGSLT